MVEIAGQAGMSPDYLLRGWLEKNVAVTFTVPAGTVKAFAGVLLGYDKLGLVVAIGEKRSWLVPWSAVGYVEPLGEAQAGKAQAV